jgi:hypothetical protein
MPAFRRLAAACLLSAAPLAAPAGAATLVPVAPVAGASQTNVFGVNDAAIVVGSFIDADGVERGYFGTIDGAYQTFDAGAGGTEARGIDNRGVITGMSNSQSGDSGSEPIFERKPNGKIVPVTRDGAQLYGAAQGLSNANDMFAGYYWDFALHQSVAFLGRRGQWRKDVKISEVHQASAARAVNSQGVVVGSYFRPPMRGFVRSGRELITVEYPSPDSQGTELEGVNDAGEATGQWTDSEGHAHSFLYDIATGAFTDIIVEGATEVQAFGINGAGAVAVSTDIGPFLWCRKKSACPSP